MGTYLVQLKKGHIDMDIGLSEYTDPKQTQNFINMLLKYLFQRNRSINELCVFLF